MKVEHQTSKKKRSGSIITGKYGLRAGRDKDYQTCFLNNFLMRHPVSGSA